MMINSPYPAPPVTPPAGHPRLMLCAADLPRIRQNLPDYPAAAARWHSLLDTPLARAGATPEYGSYHLRDCLILEARALACLLDPCGTDAHALIVDLREALDSFTVTGGIMAARWGGHLIFTAAEVYDWCYAALTDADKSAIIAACETIAEAYFEMGYPPARQMAISGHGAEAQLLRDLLAFSIAVYDERPDVYAFCAGRIFAEYVPEYNALYAAGASTQGPSYAAYRYTCMLWSELLMRPLLGRPLYTSTEPMARGFHYFRRPDGQALPLGDDFYATKSPHTRTHPFAVPMFLAYAATGCSEFLDEADGVEGYLIPDRFGLDYYKDGSWGEGLISPVSYLVFAGLTPPKPVRPWPSVCQFGDPLGITVYRAGDTHVLMKLGNFWGANHDHLDTGCFQIWHRGVLTGESGIYDSYHHPHRIRYLIRTCAHNCLTVRSPKQLGESGFSADHPNDGGTRRPCSGKEPKSYAIFREQYHMADTLAHHETEEEILLQGDLTPAYAHTCSRVVRTMRYEPKRMRFTVTDEITAKCAEHEKAFLLHCERAPRIDGNTIILEHDTARLVCRVIEPVNARITSIGGEGARFVCDGVDYSPDDFHDDIGLGWGRVVITPPKPALTDRFVVEMQIEEK